MSYHIILFIFFLLQAWVWMDTHATTATSTQAISTLNILVCGQKRWWNKQTQLGESELLLNNHEYIPYIVVGRWMFIPWNIIKKKGLYISSPTIFRWFSTMFKCFPWFSIDFQRFPMISPYFKAPQLSALGYSCWSPPQRCRTSSTRRSRSCWHVWLEDTGRCCSYSVTGLTTSFWTLFSFLRALASLLRLTLTTLTTLATLATIPMSPGNMFYVFTEAYIDTR